MVTIAEIGYGLRLLPDGQRRRELEYKFESFVELGFEQRIMDFTLAAARRYAEIMSHHKAIGRPMSLPDGQIAAIAHTHQLSLATRNGADFQNCGIALINPFATID